MSEYRLNRQQRNEISPEDLAMRILNLLQRNYRIREQGTGPYISYYPYQLSSLLNFELMTHEETSLSGIEQSFRQKFAEAVQILSNSGFIVQDPSQQHSADFQRPTSKGLTVDTSGPVFGITTGQEFIQRIESRTGQIDDVAKMYLTESFRAAEANLWLSSVFMLGAAAERLIYVLSEYIDQLLANPATSATLGNMSKVRQRKEWIISQLPALQRRFPGHREAFMDVEDKFDSLYNTYRYQRNNAGHPRDTLFSPDSVQVKTMLLSFGLYCQAVYAILAIR